MMETVDLNRMDVTDLSKCSDKMKTSLGCHTIRIGTYRFEPKHPVVFTSKGFRIIAPMCSDPTENIDLHIQKAEVIKVIAHFSTTKETASILCFYTFKLCSDYVKAALGMKPPADLNSVEGSAYFSPTGPYQFRKIMLILDNITVEAKSVITSIWSTIDEITASDVVELLSRASSSDSKASATKKIESLNNMPTPNEYRQLLIYPPGKGGITINTEDYLCLATDQYLNDIIIDFYLNWVHSNVIPEKDRDKTYVFSTFFYKRLTTLTRIPQADKDLKLSAAQKRHARVQNWTKNVNLFEKSYIIIPINEQSHWFLAVVCFPRLKGPVTFDTNIPVAPQPIKKHKEKKVSLQIGNTTITPLSKKENAALADICGVGDDGSERDEAEGDESDLASDDSDVDSASPANSITPSSSQSQAIKQPLILIFDSLAGASRSRVVATLRDYLTCEYKMKIQDNTNHAFTKANMPGHCVKVPQQNNFTDCGLYLLQYVEYFFKDPIRDYKLPIRQLSNWFDTITVTRKREEISILLQKLINERHSPKEILLPKIPLPTLDGQLVEEEEGLNEEHVEFEEEEMEEEALEEEEEAGLRDPKAEVEENVRSSKTVIPVQSPLLVPGQGRKIIFKRRILSTDPSTVRCFTKLRKTEQQ